MKKTIIPKTNILPKVYKFSYKRNKLEIGFIMRFQVRAIVVLIFAGRKTHTIYSYRDMQGNIRGDIQGDIQGNIQGDIQEDTMDYLGSYTVGIYREMYRET